MAEPEKEDLDERRPYRMRARAESTAQTAERILDAAEKTLFDGPISEASLASVAALGGVTVKTVRRRFGDKQRLFAQAVTRFGTRVISQRDVAEAGDVEGAIRILVDQYEEVGDRVLRMLAEEERHPALGTIVDMGRAYHREWCERVFAPGLEAVPDRDRERRVAQVVAATDLYAWKLLRRDSRLSRPETELAIIETVELLLGDPGGG